MNEGLLESIIDKIITHDADHPDHGVGCACMDEHAREIRILLNGKLGTDYSKSRSNLKVVLNYIVRS